MSAKTGKEFVRSQKTEKNVGPIPKKMEKKLSDFKKNGETFLTFFEIGQICLLNNMSSYNKKGKWVCLISSKQGHDFVRFEERSGKSGPNIVKNWGKSETDENCPISKMCKTNGKNRVRFE